jgi:hypothetical protein
MRCGAFQESFYIRSTLSPFDGVCSKAYEADEAKYTICDEHGQPSAGQNAHGGLHHVGSSEAGADGSEAAEGHRGRCHNGRQPVVVVGDEGAREERHGTAECERHGGSQCGLGGVGEFVEVDAEFVPGMGLQCVHPRQLLRHLQYDMFTIRSTCWGLMHSSSTETLIRICSHVKMIQPKNGIQPKNMGSSS